MAGRVEDYSEYDEKVVARSDGAIHVEVRRLRDASVETLEKAIAVLTERLNPALRPESPRAVRNGVAESRPASPLGQEIAEIADRVHAAAQRLVDLAESLDL